MRTLALRRYQFDGMLYLPKVDTGSSSGNIVLTYEKDIVFDFSGSPTAPRSLVIADEPYPTASQITRIRNKYGEIVMEGAEYTITTVEPILNMFGRVEGYKHQVALANKPDFGYDIAR